MKENERAPVATIALPTYNRAELVGRTIDRILSSGDLDDIEIIVSDNASEDNTLEVLRRFEGTKLRVFKQDRNLGALGNFDFLLSEANGEFFILHQDDDSISPDFLRSLTLAIRDEPSFEVFATPYWRGNESKGYRSEIPPFLAQECLKPEHAGKAVILPGGAVVPLFLTGMPFLHPGMAYRTSTLRAVGGFNCDSAWGADVYLTAKMLLRGNLAYLPTPLASYTEHQTNYSRTVSKHDRNRGYGTLYNTMIQMLDDASIAWTGSLRCQLEAISSSEILTLVRRWVKGDCPRSMISIGWQCYSAREKRLLRRYWRACSKLGLRSMIRAVRSSSCGVAPSSEVAG